MTQFSLFTFFILKQLTIESIWNNYYNLQINYYKESKANIKH